MEEVLSVVRSLDRRLSTPRRHLNPGDTVTLRDPSSEEERWITMSVDRKLAALLNSGFSFERADIEPDGTAKIAFTGLVTGQNLVAVTRLNERGVIEHIGDQFDGRGPGQASGVDDTSPPSQ